MSAQNTKKVRTSTWLNRLFKAPDLKGYLDKNGDLMDMVSFSEYVSGLCREMGAVPEQVVRQAQIERTYGHQIFNGTRNPGRDKVIQLAFGFGLDVTGAQRLLNAAQKYPLYPRLKRDAAILYCIHNHIDIIEAQSLLADLGLTLLGVE